MLRVTSSGCLNSVRILRMAVSYSSSGFSPSLHFTRVVDDAKCIVVTRVCVSVCAPLLWHHNANPSYKLASIPRYDDIVRTAGWAGSARAGRRRGVPPKLRGWPAADGGVLNIIVAVWTAGFHWWHSGNKSERKMLASTCLYSLCALLFLHTLIFVEFVQNCTQ